MARRADRVPSERPADFLAEPSSSGK